jgi:molybdopterin-containing oxidoreductase family membrane subunit
MAARVERLPYGIGRLSPGWGALTAILLVMVIWGIIAYTRQFTEGLVVTGLRDIGTMGGATWGLYITFDDYFVGVSFAGITTAALIRLLRLEHMRPVSRMAELLTIIALLLAAFSVLPDLGQPVRGIVNLFLYARPQSPFFGTFTLVIAGYLFASLVYFYLDGRRDAALLAQVPSRLQGLYRLWAAGYRDTPTERARHERVAFWLAIAILPLLVTAQSTLGFVFGLQVGRPGWFSALQAPGFVVMAGISGIGLLIVIAAIMRRVLQAEHQLTLAVFRWLGNILMVLTATYLYFTVAELLTTMYQGHYHEVALTQSLLLGRFAWLYWLSMLMLLVPFALLFGQFLLGRYYLPLIVLSGLLVNIAAIGKRILIVVPSQVQGMLLPYGPGTYSPTWVEYSIIGGLFALGALLFTLFTKLFPIMEVEEELAGKVEQERATAAPRASPATPEAAPGGGRPTRADLRTPLAIGLVVLGFCVQAISYFVLAAPWGTPTSPLYSNPRVLFAPGFFILGVMLVFLAAVVYELLPEPS